MLSSIIALIYSLDIVKDNNYITTYILYKYLNILYSYKGLLIKDNYLKFKKL